MTKVYYEAEGGRYLLSVKDHATGSPVVCAAVSGLCYALAGYLANAEPQDVAVYNRRMEPGDVLLHFRGDQQAQGAFEAVVIGLLQLEKKYPELVRVETPLEL
ncbi:MAG: ribosomal-processing cysteine protease Prp [Ruminiclostridium sp.]|nr:ribosomal-processing cysteine protease Prp [Ruminiclostridium sp.]